jgi:hypothetical protein
MKSARVTVGSCLYATGLDQALQDPTQGETETWLKRKHVTKVIRRSPFTELIDHTQSAQQIDG